MIIGQPEEWQRSGRARSDSDKQQQPALCRREPCSQHETHEGMRVKRRTLTCGMVARRLADSLIAPDPLKGRGAEDARRAEARRARDGQTPITLWPTRRACGACQQVEVRALVSAAKSANEAV
jgi:hypothetical protein